jgi:protein neuralized
VLQVLQTAELYSGSLTFGLTTCDPCELIPDDLPEDSHQLLDRPEYWVVVKDVANGPLAGDEIAFEITSNGKVQMTKNRQPPVTLMHVDATQTFYPFFDLYGSTLKVRLLGQYIHSLNQFPRLLTFIFSSFLQEH